MAKTKSIAEVLAGEYTFTPDPKLASIMEDLRAEHPGYRPGAARVAGSLEDYRRHFDAMSTEQLMREALCLLLRHTVLEQKAQGSMYASQNDAEVMALVQALEDRRGK